MKKFSKCISMMLVFSIILGSIFIPGNDSFAQENIEELNQKQNFEIISDNLSNFIYIYTENDINYKVIEKIDPNHEEVHSTIYKQNNDGSYEVDYTLETNVKDDTVVIIETNRSGKKYIEKIDLKDDNLKGINVDVESLSTSITPQVAPTPWSKISTSYSTNTFARLTIAAISVVIATKVASYAIGALSLASKNEIMGVAQLIGGSIVLEGMSKAYYKTNIQWRMNWNKKEQKTTTYVYKDSARTKLYKNKIMKTHTFKTIM